MISWILVTFLMREMTSCVSPIYITKRMRPKVVTKFQCLDWEMCFHHSMVYCIISLHMCYNCFVRVELHLRPLQIEFIPFCFVFYICLYINKRHVPKAFPRLIFFICLSAETFPFVEMAVLKPPRRQPHLYKRPNIFVLSNTPPSCKTSILQGITEPPQ